MQLPIEDHGVIGDLRTIALIGTDATIDFCCWPRFDSPTIFGSLLDADRGGSFEITPLLGEVRRRQLYLNETNVLLTRALSTQGVAEISDFMSMGDADRGQRIVRRAKAIRKNVRFRMRCRPAFDYGRAAHVLDRAGDDDHIFISSGPDGTRLRFRSSVPLRMEDGASCADFELSAGQSATFVLENDLGDDVKARLSADPSYVTQAFKRTANYWRKWSAASSYTGRWREVVNRSALVLKLLTSAEHGSIVAAATFGLPELAGGMRNWDYRYTWIRDAAFTVYAFLRLGYVDEANAFVRWLQARVESCDADGKIQLLYRLDGTGDLEEVELPQLSGYAGSTPVRIGNAAKDQLQLDVYGELMDSLYLSDKYGEQVSWQSWEGLVRTMNWVAKNWRSPDEGIWEMRDGRHEFLHSRLMCWVALDRVIRLARKRSLPAPFERWARERDAIYHDIHESFWDASNGTFVQRKGSNDVDASCLLMPLVRFIAPTDPRWLSTLKAIGERLTDDSMLFRYRNDGDSDGLTGDEGTFNMCSFWYVECIARAGDLTRARFLFEKMLGYSNHVGLFSEETGPAGEHLGNFPQAFTHMALISAAYYLNRAHTDG